MENVAVASLAKLPRPTLPSHCPDESQRARAEIRQQLNVNFCLFALASRVVEAGYVGNKKEGGRGRPRMDHLPARVFLLAARKREKGENGGEVTTVEKRA